MFAQRSRTAIAALVFLLASGIVTDGQCAVIGYSATNTLGNTWRYDYTVSNNSLGSPLEEFTIYFDRTLYENLAVAASPADWDSLVVQPDLALPDDGFFDSLAMTTGIAVAGALSGFSVSLDFLGQGAPGAQYFEVVNPTTFAVLESGTTVVPAPSAGLLLATGLMAAARFRRRPLHRAPFSNERRHE